MSLLNFVLLLSGIIMVTSLFINLTVAVSYFSEDRYDYESYLESLDMSIEAEFSNTFEKIGDEWFPVIGFDEDLYITKESETEKRIMALEQLDSIITMYRTNIRAKTVWYSCYMVKAKYLHLYSSKTIHIIKV